MRLNPGRTPPK